MLKIVDNKQKNNKYKILNLLNNWKLKTKKLANYKKNYNQQLLKKIRKFKKCKNLITISKEFF